jgi:4-amino-4-deoxy-L-arabinose transferase-like glycosyltransferase
MKSLSSRFVHSPIFWVSCFFIALHLFRLTALPIFNDEAIYLDWGWRQVHSPQFLYFSLFDGKQPFLMWVFGLAEIITSNPLWAGRFVSVVFGLLTLFGLNTLTKRYFPQLKSWQVCLLYSLLPLFVFFNRQALMESAVAAVGVWSCYFCLRFIEKAELKWAVSLGVALGLGLFIKTTPIIFCVMALGAGLFSLRTLKKNKWEKQICYLLLGLVVSQIVVLPLYLQPNFHNIIDLNTRFTLSVGEMVRLPILVWLTHFLNTSELLVVYLTPFILAVILISSWRIIRFGNFSQKVVLGWLAFGLLSFILTVRTPSPRYIVSLLPLSAVLAIDGLEILKKKFPKFQAAALITLLIIPAFFTICLLVKPLSYFEFLSRFTRYSQQTEYVSDWTSGYGVAEACNYLKAQAQRAPIHVLIRLDSGNPENSMMLCFQKIPQVEVGYLPKEVSVNQVRTVLCASPKQQVFFVSRDVQLANLESILRLQMAYRKPLGDRYVGVYAFDPECGL